MAKEATSFSDSAPESENRPEGDIQPDESATAGVILFSFEYDELTICIAETPNMAKEVTSFSDGALKSDEQRPEGEISAVAGNTVLTTGIMS